MTSYISNDPLEKRRLTYSHVWWENAFTEEELNTFEDYCNNLNMEEAGVIGNSEGIRKSLISFVNKDDTSSWIFNKYNHVINELNNLYYNFDLYGYKAFQYTTYESSDLGKYDWHMDTVLDNRLQDNMWSEGTRKLTVIMLLNNPEKDFTGGEFQLNFGGEDRAHTIKMTRGKIYAFPSFLMHRVKPVLTGVRKSIVIWVEGPKFI